MTHLPGRWATASASEVGLTPQPAKQRKRHENSMPGIKQCENAATLETASDMAIAPHHGALTCQANPIGIPNSIPT